MPVNSLPSSAAVRGDLSGVTIRTAMAVELRHWRVEDAGAQARAIEESLEHLRPWMPWIDGGAEAAARRARRCCASGRPSASRGPTSTSPCGSTASSSAAAGCTAGSAPAGSRSATGSTRAHLRRGLATEVARQLTERAFADPAIDRVEIHHDRANVGQRRRAGQARLRARRRDAPGAPEAPGEEGVERVWRLSRAAWTAARAAPPPGRS